MGQYIDADRLRAEIEKIYKSEIQPWLSGVSATSAIYDYVLPIIYSLKQDDTQVDKMPCSQIWWEEQGWILIPPDATIKGIDSLLKQVRKKPQQEQPEVDLEKELEDYARENPTEDAGSYRNLMNIACHFYELGLNARKEN